MAEFDQSHLHLSQNACLSHRKPRVRVLSFPSYFRQKLALEVKTVHSRTCPGGRERSKPM